MNLVIIPARGGSKAVPRKNIKSLNGKPLIHYTIEAARKLFMEDEIIVSTDDLEIKEVVESMGLMIPFLRPKELASDAASSEDVILHTLDYFKSKYGQPDKVILLQPTSPFRKAKHIKEAIELYDEEFDMLVSVKETKANPYYVLREENEKGYLIKSKESNATRRQDVPKVWELNGAIYIINPNALKHQSIGEFKKVKKYVMDEVSSHDIDTIIDWKFAELLMSIQKDESIGSSK